MIRWYLGSIVACVAFASSAAADTPSTSAASTEEHRALMISAQVMRKEAKLLRSRDLLASCSSKDCAVDQAAECAEIRGFCSKLLADVTNAIPTVSLHVQDDRGVAIRADRLELDSLTVDPSTPILIDPGAHVVKALFAGRTGETDLVVLAGQKNINVVVRIDLKRNVQRRPIPLPVYVLGGTAIASGLLALGTGIYTAHGYQGLDNCQPYCDPNQETRLRTTGYIADVSTIVALASAVAGTIWFLARPTVTEVQRLDATASESAR